MPSNEIGNTSEKSLIATIQKLYAVFNRYCLKPSEQGRDGLPIEELDLPPIKPLKTLRREELERYASRALTTAGTLQDFKRFLPRILELVAFEGDVGDTDIEIVFGKLEYGQWLSWPAEEHGAVSAFLTQVWKHARAEYPGTFHDHDYLCGLAQAVDDLAPYLDAWTNDDSVSSARHLADLIANNFGAMPRTFGLKNAFWEARRQQMAQVVRWVLGTDVSRKLEVAFFASADSEIQRHLSDAIAAQEWMRQRSAELPHLLQF